MTALGPSKMASLGGVLLTASVTVSRASSAESPLVELQYQRPPGAAGCPDEVSFRAAVAHRLGRAPFASKAARTIVVQLRREGAGWAALIRVLEDGDSSGERAIDAAANCEELAEGAALAVSMAIDPALGLGASAERPELQLEPSAPRSAVPPQPAVADWVHLPERQEPDGSTGVWILRVGTRAWLGAVPALSAGPSLGLGHRREAWSLWFDAFGVLPRSREVPRSDRAVSASLWGAQLAPCFESRWARGCVWARSGMLLASGRGVDVPASDASWHASLGAGVGRTFDWDRFSLTPSIEGDVRLLSTVLFLEGEPVWRTPRLSGSFVLELGYRL